MFLRRLEDVTKNHFFWDVSERSLRWLSQWRPDWYLSETFHAGWDEIIFSFLQMIILEISYSVMVADRGKPARVSENNSLKETGDYDLTAYRSFHQQFFTMRSDKISLTSYNKEIYALNKRKVHSSIVQSFSNQ